MGKGETSAEQISKPSMTPPIHPAAGIVAPVAGLIGAWTAAGSIGLMGHPLRHALSWLAMAIVIVGAWPRIWRPWHQTAVWVAGIVAAVAMTGSGLVPINVMAVALLLAVTGIVRPDAARSMRSVAAAAAVLGLYRLAVTSIPALWLMADRVGGLLGRGAGWITGQPLNVGATFGGLDFLVAMIALYVIWLAAIPRPRWRAAAWGAAGIIVAQFGYLLILSAAPSLLEVLTRPLNAAPTVASAPTEKAPPPGLDERFSSWLAESVPWKELLPWNVPALAALFQAGIAAAMLWSIARARSVHRGGLETGPTRIAGPQAFGERLPLTAHRSPTRGLISVLPTATAGLLAALVPLATVLAPYHATLENKKIVAFEKGMLNWDKPVHGQYGRLMIGMYGMFGQFVESLGGSFARSPDLSEKDLSGVDLLVLFYPTQDFKAEQLQRVQKYVAAGGKLLLMCDHTGRESAKADDRFDLHESRFNELLEPTSIRVGFDAAEFAIGGWLESYEALAHPTTLGIEDSRNVFGVVIGASLEIQSPAVPLLIGRWGFSDAGDEGTWPAMLGNQRYDAGEKLGDLVLAAEQSWGSGRVLVFGDTSTLNNGIVIGSNPFASRLLAYMAGDGATAAAPLRQWAGAILVAALTVLLCWRPTAARAACVAVSFSMSLAIGAAVTGAATELLPDGGRLNSGRTTSNALLRSAPGSGPDLRTTSRNDSGKLTDPAAATATRADDAGAAPVSQTNRLAYIDMSHLGTFSEEITRPDGIFGFEYALMRDDYLVLSLYDTTYERLSRAGLFASLGPQRSFTSVERRAIRQFVEEGGIFILTTGFERSAASRELLGDFKFTVGATAPGLPTGTEPVPLGHFKAPFYEVQGDYQAYVRFHAAWPISCADPAAKTIAKGFADRPFDPGAGGFGMDGRSEVPVIMVRDVKKGKVVVIGDTEFATNKNLENEDGSPIEGLRENADFWRWLIPQLRGTTPWYPPNQQPITPPMETKP